jgi:hypothetical protein
MLYTLLVIFGVLYIYIIMKIGYVLKVLLNPSYVNFNINSSFPLNLNFSSAADSDPGSGALLTTGFGISFFSGPSPYS